MIALQPTRRLLCAALAAGLLVSQLLLAGTVPSFAEGDRDDKVAEKASVDQQLEDVRVSLEGTNQDLADTYVALAETELRIPEAQQALEDAQAAQATAEEENRLAGERLQTAQDELDRLTSEVETGKAEVDASDEQLAQIALDAYKGGGTPNPASVYIGSQEPQQAVDRSMNYKLTLSAQDSELGDLRDRQSLTENSADRVSAVEDEVADLKVKAQEAEDEATRAADDAARAKQDLDDLYAAQIRQRDDLEAKKTQYQGDASALADRGDTLDSEIAELAREESERGSSGGGSGGSLGAVSGAGFLQPVAGRLNSNFGWRVHPIYHTRKLHKGVDFPSACGTPVRAAADGRVDRAYFNSRAGNKVILTHGTRNGKVITTSYHHLQRYAVSSGQSVSRGQVVGYIGTTGSSTGCHLHFEVHENGTAVNPMNYL
ncbi:peptidoglycan DD-metalloendopeptidase family protein [Brachybacterium hainanense]|uniref:Peptidoglycan DD-metalloendopeptidase family protein n=1 Tax=Brachybacterium hainanense TaxID=1541174 RepID=A0ABV6RGJ1_9MICO